jgi:hypothetical protein
MASCSQFQLSFRLVVEFAFDHYHDERHGKVCELIIILCTLSEALLRTQDNCGSERTAHDSKSHSFIGNFLEITFSVRLDPPVNVHRIVRSLYRLNAVSRR